MYGEPGIEQPSSFFTITKAVVEVLSSGTVTLDSGASGSVDGITVNGTEVMSGAEVFDADLDTTATAVAANITANTSYPNYNASATGAVITITAIAGTGSVPNTFVIVSTTTTLATTDVNMAGGVTEVLATGTVTLDSGAAGGVDGITVDSVEVMSGAEAFVDTLNNLATAIASNITANTSSPDYNASASGAVITITAIADSGAGPNGFIVVSTPTPIIVATDVDMANGVTAVSEVLATGTVELTGGASGIVNQITVNGVDVMDIDAHFVDTLDNLATLVASIIDANTSSPDYDSSASGATITITAKAGTGDGPNGFVVVSDTDTITTTDTNMASGVTAISEVLATGTSTLDSGTAGRIDGLTVNSVEMLSNAETLATGTATLSNGGAGSVDGILVNGVEVMSGAESWVDTLDNLATAVASNITANTSSPDYNASASGAVVTITAIAGTGYAPNRFTVVTSTTTIVSTDVDMAGGIAANSVPFNSTLNQTATDLAANIQANTSSPDYDASASGAIVTITAKAGTGAGPNTFVVATSVPVTIATSDVNMANGVTEVLATGTVTVDSGTSGSVSGIVVNSVQVMSGEEVFVDTIANFATAIAANITAHTSSPNYTASASGAIVTISAVADSGAGPNAFVVTSTVPAIIATTDVDMASGVDTPDPYKPFSPYVSVTGNLEVMGLDNVVKILPNVEVGWQPIKIKKVMNANTTATVTIGGR